MASSSGGARPAWAPGSWASGEVEELDVDPRELVQKIREHRGEGLIDLDAPRATASGAEAEAAGG